jgi:predicted nucleotidyltransferase
MKALVIFGSKACHDSEPDSDVDLLGVYDGDSVIPKAIDNVHLFLYPEKTYISLNEIG